jgi:hypothetical protein
MADYRTVTERWCQAVRELYELQQNSATDRRGNFEQLNNAITYGSFRDDIPNKFDKQQFLYQQQSSNGGSQTSNSPFENKAPPSQSPGPGQYAEVLQTPQSTYHVEEKPQLLYPPTSEISPAARRKAEEERAMLEAMTQSASLPESPFLGPLYGMSFQFDMPQGFRDPGDESFQFGTHVPVGFNVNQMTGGTNGLGMEEFPSLDEIISNMEGGGMENTFGFLDDLNLFDGPM